MPSAHRAAVAVGSLQVKTGLVLDDDVAGAGVGLADLPQERRINIPVDSRGEVQFLPVGAVDFERLMEVAPLKAVGSGRVHAHPATPTAPDNRQQTVAVLAEQPKQHRPFSAGAGLGQFSRQSGLEDLHLRRVLLCVGLARHLQDAAGFSQQRMTPAKDKLRLARASIHACASFASFPSRGCARNASRAAPATLGCLLPLLFSCFSSALTPPVRNASR